MRVLSFIILGLLISSCGEDNSDNDDNTVPPRQEERESPIRWTKIELVSEDGFIDYYFHSLSMEFNRDPVIIDGSFETEDRECTFSIPLTEAEAQRLTLAGEDLGTCVDDIDDGDIRITRPTNSIFLTDRNAVETVAFKDRFTDLPLAQTWLCRGKENFYSTLKSLMQEKLPEECPPDALERF